LPQSASCSENFVIPPDVFGQTLRVNYLCKQLRQLVSTSQNQCFRCTALMRGWGWSGQWAGFHLHMGPVLPESPG
jgi:hypothetical protein